MTTTGTVIVGAGQAGCQLAVSLREHGYTDPITILGSEESPPYQRPPLSKDYLLGTSTAVKLELRKANFYAAKNISLHTATTVTDVEITDDGGTAIAGTGDRFGFRHLALATGSQPRRLPQHIGVASNIHYLRTLDDARLLQSALADAEKFVVIGGGFIGLEAAAVLQAHDKHVVVVEMADRLLKRVAGPELGEFYRAAHIGRGVDIRLSRSVTALRTDSTGRAVGVTLDDGEVVPCDAIVAGLGVVRDPGLPQRLGVEWDNGIVVDRFARTSRPTVVAAGDCTVGPHPMATQSIRLESVQNAVDQAKTAAATICGLDRPYTAVPWFWSNQGTMRLQTAGLIAGSDRRVIRGDLASEDFAVVYLRDQTLIAVEAMNRPGDFAAARKLLAAGAELRVSDSSLADTALPLREAFDIPATDTERS